MEVPNDILNRITTNCAIIQVQDNKLGDELLCKGMDGKTEQKRTQGISLLHTFCSLRRRCTPVKSEGCSLCRVYKSEELQHQISDLVQHLVLPDAIECIGEVQLENYTVRLEAVKVALSCVVCSFCPLGAPASQLARSEGCTYISEVTVIITIHIHT